MATKKKHTPGTTMLLFSQIRPSARSSSIVENESGGARDGVIVAIDTKEKLVAYFCVAMGEITVATGAVRGGLGGFYFGIFF